jgi:hypothetical protein
VNTALPSVSGVLVQGQTLMSSAGAWEGIQPISFAFQWQRCDQSGASCADIAGATSQNYLLATADVGHRLRVGVGASNSAGAAAVLSNPTGVITATPTPTTTTTTTTTTGSAPPLTKQSCKHDGWRAFTNPRFKNQGQCVRFVNQQHHNNDRHHNHHDQNDDNQGNNNQGNNGNHGHNPSHPHDD